MADKHTKRELFENLLVIVAMTEADEWIVNGVQHELDLLNKRASNKSVDVKRKAEQDALKGKIAIALEDSSEAMRATEIAQAIEVSVQRATALLRQMVLAGEVTRHEDKKVVTFSLS